MNQADATALLSGMADLQSISVNAQQGEGSTTYADSTGAGLRAVTANTGEGVGDPAVTGFQKILTPDLEGAADVKGRARFVGNYDASGKLTGIERQDVGLSGGFLADNLETIGPLAVALAAGAGALAGGGTGGTAAGAGASGAGAETGAAIAGIDQVAPVTAGKVGAGGAAAGGAGAGGAGAGAAGGSTLLDRVLASPIAQQAAGMMLASTIVGGTQGAKTPAPTIEAPAPAPTPSAAATQPELAPITQALGNKYDTPVSTFLTGPGGIDPTKLRLGRNVLLGAA